MSQTTTPSGADVLAVMDEFVIVVGDEFGNDAGVRLRDARTAVAALIADNDLLRRVQASTATEAVALIARNAELEAERDALVGARDKVKSLKRELAELQASRSGNFEGYQSAIEWAEHELQAVIDRYGCSALARTPAKENGA